MPINTQNHNTPITTLLKKNTISTKTTTMAISSKPQIELIQSVSASKTTNPRLTRRVEPGPAGFKRSCNTVLYYKGAEGYATVFVGLIKESLGRAFEEKPFYCGRIRKTDGGFEFFTNDSGARLIEAKIGVGLETYLSSEGREKAETELVQWKDIDEEDPQYSPLIYIQVTYFECGGFAVGISHSLLLLDPLAFSTFLKRLETIHSAQFTDEISTVAPSLFYLHNPMKYPRFPYGIKPSPKTSKTVVFKFEGSVLRSEYGPLALLCIKEAEVESQIGVEFVMLVKDQYGATEVESVAKIASQEKCGGIIEHRLGMGRLRRVSWDEFGMSEVMFRFQTVKEVPLGVSHWFGSADGFVMVVESGSGEVGGDNVYVFVSI